MKGISMNGLKLPTKAAFLAFLKSPKVIGGAVLVILWALNCGARIYWFTQKDAFHNDEVISIITSQNNSLGLTYNYAYGNVYSGKAVKEATLMTDTTFKEMWSDIGKLRIDSANGAHTNFYLTLFRIALGRLKSGNIKDLIPRAGALNLILFTISFFVFFKLMQMLFKEYRVIPYLAVFCAFIATGPISNTLYFRLYQLQETMMILLAYFFLKYRDTKKLMLSDDGKTYIHFAFLVVMSVVAGLTMLTGYVVIIYVGFIGLYAIIYSIYRKKPVEIAIYFFLLITGMLLAGVAYVPFLPSVDMTIRSGITRLSGYIKAAQPSAEAAAGAAFAGVAASKTQLEIEMEMIMNMPPIKTLLNFLNLYFWSLPVIIITIITACFAAALYLAETKKGPGYLLTKKTIGSFFISPRFMLSVSAVAFILLGIVGADFKEMRYGVPAYPFLVILPMVILEKIKDKRVLYALTAAFAVCFSVNTFNESKLWGVWHNVPAQRYRFAAEPDIPAFVICSSSHYPLLVPYLADDQAYIFDDNIQSALEKFKFDEFFIIINDPLIPANPIYTASMGLEVLETYRVGVNIGLWTVGKFRRVPVAAADAPPPPGQAAP